MAFTCMKAAYNSLKPLPVLNFTHKKLRCPTGSTDALFQLIQSLEKSEKRNFKLYVKRNTANDDLKIIQLFDALDKMDRV